jgi:hypothetical protein
MIPVVGQSELGTVTLLPIIGSTHHPIFFDVLPDRTQPSTWAEPMVFGDFLDGQPLVGRVGSHCIKAHDR